LPWWVKAVVALLLLIASQYHFWSRLSSGSVFAPEFPRPLIILFNWVSGATLLLAALQIVLDLGALATMLTTRHVGGWPDGVRYAAAGAAALVAAIGVAGALRVPPLKDVEIKIRNLPAQFDGYRLLQLTDLHISRLFPAKWTRAMVDRANALGVELIVVTGDFIDGSVAMRQADVEPLRDLHAPDGVYAIPGNHEYFFDYDAWMHHLAGMGFRMLPNAHAVLQRGEQKLILAGVTDLSAPRFGQVGPDLSTALAGAPADVPVLLLDHQPRQARQAAARGIALQLSGHTHGGMVRGLDRLVARANGGFVSGRYDVDNMTLYVNNGTALWPGFALRLGRPSELTRITLRCHS
jgi:predicted MPP superfamily phosphohydrolase